MSGGGSNKIKDTKAQKQLAQIAAKRFNLYQQYYVPLENQFMSDVFKMQSPSQMESVQSFVTALQQPQFQKQKMQQEQMAKNQKDLIKKGKMNELGIKEEDRDGQDEEAKSDMSALGPKMSEDHQTNPDQQNLFRVQKILARNSNLIKEPQLYSKDIEI